jgi:hypothetical protein
MTQWGQAPLCRFFLLFERGDATTVSMSPPICYKTPPSVATTASEKHKISWNQSKSVITLHQKSEMISLFDLLTQTKHKGVIISTLGAYYISLRPD